MVEAYGRYPVEWLTRAFYIAYTSAYGGSQRWSYVIGGPTSGEFQNGVATMQYYEGGTMAWWPADCRVRYYNTRGQLVKTWQGSSYCADGGPAAWQT